MPFFGAYFALRAILIQSRYKLSALRLKRKIERFRRRKILLTKQVACDILQVSKKEGSSWN